MPVDHTELARAQTRIVRLSAALLGCRDMLSESAKQHRLNDDGHAALCEQHKANAERVLRDDGWIAAEREREAWYAG